MMFFSVLKRPHNLNNNNWRLVVFISLCVFFVLSIFQPFGLASSHFSNKYIILFGYGLITFIILTIEVIFLKKIFRFSIFNEDNWKVYKEIIWILFIILSISIGNYFYSIWVFSDYFKANMQTFIIFAFFTFTIGLIPVTLITLIKSNQNLRNYIKNAGLINQKIQETPSIHQTKILTFKSLNKKEKDINIPIQQFLYIVSRENYVEIFYSQNSIVQSQLIRNTLSNIENEFLNDPLFRCHRAFIINTLQIEKANGNSNGYKVSLKNINETIPVSRSYAEAFKNIILL